MSKVEDLALEALDMYAPKGINEQVGLVYTKAAVLGMYKDGYHQAEKELELTWEDMMIIHKCIKDVMNFHLYKMMEGVEGQQIVYQEVLKRFKEQKVKEVDLEKEIDKELETRRKGEQKSFARYKVGDTIYYSLFGKLVGFVIANIVEDGTDNPKYENKSGDCIFQNDIIEPTTRLIRLNKSLRKIYYSSSRKPY